MSRRTDTASEAALRDYGDALRRRRATRRRLAVRAGLIGTGCAALLFTMAKKPAPRLLWNASASAPVGLYAVSSDGAVDVGDMVIAWPPESVSAMAATRHYLPRGVPLVKRIVAGPGDRICASGPAILIDGRVVASRLATDHHGRPLPWWSGCRTLRDHQYLLLMADVPDSFDGRYFGVTNGSDIIGRARLLWRP
ncbi:S26 family signal peptidase [Sphingomonas oryzagri]